MSTRAKYYELIISEIFEEELRQIKKICGARNLLLEGLEEFLSNRVDARRVNFAQAVIGYAKSDIDFWVGDYFLIFTSG